MFYHEDPQQAVQMRANAAQVMLQLPFWKEMEEYMHELCTSALSDVRGAEHADANVSKGLTSRWIGTEQLVNKIRKFPVAAVEAAREASEKSSLGI